jgi:parallel beta-helix repeat protein
MNEQSDFERYVADQLGSAAMGTPPEAAITGTIERAGGSRRLPEWLALIKEPPMRTNSHLAVGSPTVRVAAIVMATLLLAVAIAAVGAGAQRLLAADAPIIVDATGDGDYQSIGEAVGAARDGDEVVVRAGTYVESVLIDKDITVRGDGPADRVVVSAPVDGPTFVTNPDAGPEPYAFLLADTAATLSGLTLQGESSSVIASGGSPTIEGNVFDAVGVLFDGQSFSFSGGAIVATDGSTATIRGNDVLSSGPIVAFGGSGPLVEDNNLVDGGPIWLEDASDQAAIVNNTVEGQVIRGISVSSPGQISIERNRITGATDIGLRIGRNSGAAGYEPLVRGNTISGTGVAIRVNDGGAPTIDDNTLTGNESAIVLGRDVTGSVTANTLKDNEIGMNLALSGPVVSGNAIDGGQIGISISGGAAQLNDNTVENAGDRGIAIGGEAQTVLRSNRSCGNGENLWVADTASPDIDQTNEICEDAAAE